MKTAIIVMECAMFLTCALCAAGDGFLVAEPVAPYGDPILGPVLRCINSLCSFTGSMCTSMTGFLRR